MLILTARDAVESRIAGLDAGADDYLIKPLSTDELAARLRAVMRRAKGRPEPVWHHGALSAGNGSGQHVLAAALWHLAGVELVHVPYRGQYMPDLISGQVQVVFNPMAQALPLIREGKLRALAVTSLPGTG